MEALESRRLLDALVIDVTHGNAYARHGTTDPPAPATTAAGNDDFGALNWLVNVQTIGDIQVGTSVRIWDGGSGTTPHSVTGTDTFGGLFFPAGEFGLSQRLGLRGVTSGDPIIYTGVGASYNTLTGAVTNPGSVITKPTFPGQPTQHDHFAFDLPVGAVRDNITIKSLTFEGCGISVLNGSADNFKVENNLVRNAQLDSAGQPAWNGVGTVYTT